MKKLKIMKGSMRMRCTLCLLLGGACDGATSGDAPAAAATPSASASDGASRTRKDNGNATVKLDGSAWAAERCTARVKPDDGGERLSLTCSRTTAGAVVQREEIALVVRGYVGAGDYTSAGNSHFARVAVDTKAAGAAADEAARAGVVTDSIAGAKVVNLAGARVTVTASDGAAIDGTFSWTPQPGSEGPSLTDGSFHAVVKK